MEIITKVFNKQDFFFDKMENGELYLNATKTARSFNKDVRTWRRSKQTIEYIDSMTDVQNLHTEKLIKVIAGGNNKKAQGTWIHKKLIIVFARWLNSDFAVWCDLQIEEILKGGSTPKDNFQKRKEQFQLDVIGLESSFKLLRVNEASKIGMTHKLYKEHGLSKVSLFIKTGF